MISKDPHHRVTLVITRALTNSDGLGLTKAETLLLLLLTMMGICNEPDMAASWYLPKGFRAFCEEQGLDYETYRRAKWGLVKKGFLVERKHSSMINAGLKEERKYGDFARRGMAKGAIRGSTRWNGAPMICMPQSVVEDLMKFNEACKWARECRTPYPPVPVFTSL